MAVQYRPLDRSMNEIRLLRISPQAQNAKHKLLPACHIFHAYLPQEPHYVALSWVWGDQASKRVILVDDSPVYVTTNLYDAMMALRPVSKYLVIWIDFLSIDQTNDDEKSWQVELMTDIYRQAIKVYAWLGQADCDSDQVMAYLNTFGEKAEACEIFNVEGHHLDIWRGLLNQGAAIHDPKPSHVVAITENGYPRSISCCELNEIFYSISGWHRHDNLIPVAGMQRLFKRPFWGRIWVLQEITLPSNAQFICGTKEISRRRCSAAINAYAALRLILMQKFENDPFSLKRYHQTITTQLFHHRPNVLLSSFRDIRFSLVALLRATCVGSFNHHRHGPHHFESTDPRDKIFALLSLASDRADLRRRGVFPNYSKSCAEIYTLAMAAMLEQGHTSLLLFCQMPKLVPDLPSWVPDWSRSATGMLQNVENDHVTLYPTFNASGADCHTRNLTIRREKGSIQGISVVCRLYDEIDNAGSFPGRASSHEVPLSETSSWPMEWLMEILRLTYYNEQYYKSFRHRLSAVARSSAAGLKIYAASRYTRVGDDRFSDAVVLVKNGRQYATEKRTKLDIERFLASKTAKDLEAMKDFEFKAIYTRLGPEIIGHSLGRLPFITSKGHLVVSSEHVKPRDVVALVKGLQVPLILRRQNNTGKYELISEAYVDGIMDGEAADDTKFASVELV
jgi:hypothetical protein